MSPILIDPDEKCRFRLECSDFVLPSFSQKKLGQTWPSITDIPQEIHFHQQFQHPLVHIKLNIVPPWKEIWLTIFLCLRHVFLLFTVLLSSVFYSFSQCLWYLQDEQGWWYTVWLIHHDTNVFNYFFNWFKKEVSYGKVYYRTIQRVILGVSMGQNLQPSHTESRPPT